MQREINKTRDLNETFVWSKILVQLQKHFEYDLIQFIEPIYSHYCCIKAALAEFVPKKHQNVVF